MSKPIPISIDEFERRMTEANKLVDAIPSDASVKDRQIALLKFYLMMETGRVEE